ncbi:MAG: hypothetical protein M1814_005712 [Vezdaea aestivalis]|nr:MAG: hypothetical protein M1814_005712 [Vezdaea aestivalis]
MPKIVVTGATGFLGRAVVLSFEQATDPTWEVVGTGFSRATPPIHKLDITDSTAIATFLDQEKPQVVIHCAANRSPESVAASPDAARALNVDATASLASATGSRRIMLIYISTDYVFPGRKGEAPYEFTQKTEPANLYGLTKRDGEKKILELCPDALGMVLRVPVLYGKGLNEESSINVLVDAVKKLQGGEKVKMDHWARRFPTCTSDVGRVLVDITNFYRRCEQFLPRILHFSGPECFTKYEMASLFADILGVDASGLVKDVPEEGEGVNRPFDTQLGTASLQGIGISRAAEDFRGWWQRELGAVRH